MTYPRGFASRFVGASLFKAVFRNGTVEGEYNASVSYTLVKFVTGLYCNREKEEVNFGSLNSIIHAILIRNLAAGKSQLEIALNLQNRIHDCCRHP